MVQAVVQAGRTSVRWGGVRGDVMRGLGGDWREVGGVVTHSWGVHKKLSTCGFFYRLIIQERAEGTVCGFEQWWRIREVYQSFVHLFLLGGGFTIVRESRAVGGVHHVYRERFSTLSAQETLRLEGVTFREESRETFFACKERLPCTFFCWADLELNLSCAPPPSGDE